MTVLEKIKQTGGFADFGAVGSMPLGYFLDGTPALSMEYYEAQRLKADKAIIVVGEIGNGAFRSYLTKKPLTGDLLKCKP